MARICGGDECVEHDYSSGNPLTYDRINRGYGKGKEFVENIAYRFGYILELLVLRATNVDELSGAFLPTKRKIKGLYRVIMSNQTGSECKTRVTVGDLEPIWNQCFKMLLDEVTVPGFLNLELIDENHGEDPKTSQGRVVVGRAQIPLPANFGVVEARRAELVKEVGFGNTVVGYIYLKSRLSRVHAQHIACLP